MKQQKFKSALLVMLTLVLVSATAVAITWAAKTEDKFGKVENTFTDNPDISLAIAENTWDGLDYDGKNPAGGNGTPTTDAELKKDETFPIKLPDNTSIEHVSDLGKTRAQTYNADDVIPKNPSLKNDTTYPTLTAPESSFSNGDNSISEWVAMKVTYKLTVPDKYYTKNDTQTGGANGTESNPYAMNEVASGGYIGKVITFDSYTNFKNALAKVQHAETGHLALNSLVDGILVGTTANEENWKDISDPASGTLFMYNKVLAKNAETKPLFDAVKINNVTEYGSVVGSTQKLYKINLNGGSYDNTAIDEDTYIYVSTLPEFEIDLKGYAIQSENVSYDQAPAELRALAASN